MPLLLIGLQLLHLCNGGSAVKSDPIEIMIRNENGIEDQVKELMQKVEKMENKLETKSVEVEILQTQLKEVQKKKHQNHEVEKNEMAMQCKAEVKKELDKVLPMVVEQGLRDLPFEMVCAYQGGWTAANSIINYDRISVEFNNSDRP